jgi:hypothetical protein
MKDQSVYLKKSRIHVELEYSTAFTEISEILIEWKKQKPDNKQLKACASALAKIGVIVAGYQMELEGVERMVSQYRSDRLKYQKEALEATQKLNDYEKKYFGETGN